MLQRLALDIVHKMLTVPLRPCLRFVLVVHAAQKRRHQALISYFSSSHRGGQDGNQLGLKDKCED